MVFWVLKKRHYVYSHCKKRFYEFYDLLDVYTKKEIEKQYQISSTTVSRILKMVSFEKPNLPKVLWMDKLK